MLFRLPFTPLLSPLLPRLNILPPPPQLCPLFICPLKSVSVSLSVSHAHAHAPSIHPSSLLLLCRPMPFIQPVLCSLGRCVNLCGSLDLPSNPQLLHNEPKVASIHKRIRLHFDFLPSFLTWVLFPWLGFYL